MFKKGKLSHISWKENKEEGTLEVCGEIKKGDEVKTGCIVYAVSEGRLVPLPNAEGDPDVLEEINEFVRRKMRVK